MTIITRPFEPGNDSGFIYDSYPKALYFGSLIPIAQDRTSWMRAFHQQVGRELASYDVRVACTQNEPTFIVGYSIISRAGILHFVYVKADYRNKGIGTLLTRGKFSGIESAKLTKVGSAIFSKLTNGAQNGNIIANGTGIESGKES